MGESAGGTLVLSLALLLKEKGFVEDPIRKAAHTAQEGTKESGEEEAAPAEEVQTGEKKASGKGSNRGPIYRVHFYETTSYLCI